MQILPSYEEKKVTTIVGLLTKSNAPTKKYRDWPKKYLH